MSWQITTLIAEKRFGSSTRKLIALCLGNHAGPNGEGIYPAVRTLAESAEVDQRTVQRAIRQFEDEGLLMQTGERKCRGGATKEYAFVVEAVRSLPDVRVPQEGEPPAQCRPGTVSPPAHDPETPGTVPPEPSGTVINQPRRKRARVVDSLPEDWQPRPEERELAFGELKFTPQEFDHAASEFRDYWGDRAHLRAGCKSNWDRTFANRLRELASRWGTSRRASSAGDQPRKRQGGSSLADAAARLYAQG